MAKFVTIGERLSTTAPAVRSDEMGSTVTAERIR